MDAGPAEPGPDCHQRRGPRRSLTLVVALVVVLAFAVQTATFVAETTAALEATSSMWSSTTSVKPSTRSDMVQSALAIARSPGVTGVRGDVRRLPFRDESADVGERLPGGPPPKIHDPALFIAPRRLVELFARHGVGVGCHGLRPSVVDYLRFLRGRSSSVRMLPARPVAAVYQGLGTKPR